MHGKRYDDSQLKTRILWFVSSILRSTKMKDSQLKKLLNSQEKKDLKILVNMML